MKLPHHLARPALACPGLGRVRRGNEAWAEAVAQALHAAGVPVTLLVGAPLAQDTCPCVPLWNWPREAWLTRRWFSWHHRYLAEQLTFAWMLKRWLRRNPHPITHVADPALAQEIQKRARTLGTRVLYKDGLNLGPAWCRQFDHVQVLAPYYLEQANAAGVDTRNWFVIPHLVDGQTFRPAPDRAALRRELFPDATENEFIVMAAGAYAPGNRKRLDWILDEFARLDASVPSRLVIAGAASPAEFAAFRNLAEARLGKRARLFANVAGREMLRLFQAADGFAHAALQEPFGIVLLEAMATGLPVCGHRFPVTEWIIGDGGQCVDMTAPGQLAGVLQAWRARPEQRAVAGQRARNRATTVFSPKQIVPLYQAAYERMVAA